MQHLFTHDGEAALAAVLRLRPLLAFDFDGTLAPIVARPEDARISQAVSTRLEALASHLPLAIVTGRMVDDVRGRLGFEPWSIMGNHGAEDPLDPGATRALSQTLDPLRDRLTPRASALAALGVTVEDKGVSMALHYRLSRERERAQALIAELLAPMDERWHVFGGKMVVNIAPVDAPDKAVAVHSLVARAGAGAALFAGDDLNDEPVFASAPPHWLTVRIDRREARSQARFFLGSASEVAMLLEHMLALITSPKAT